MTSSLKSTVPASGAWTGVPLGVSMVLMVTSERWCSSGRGEDRSARVLVAPVEGIVGDFLPPRLADGEVAAPRELDVVRVRSRLRVVVRVGLVDLGGHDVVLAARDEQQRRPFAVAEVDPRLLVARGEVGQHAAPDPGAGRGDVVALVGLGRLLLA